VQSYYFGKNVAPAREIIELNLIEEFHWTPQQISSIPYKTLQRIFFIRNQRSAVQQAQISANKIKSQNKTTGSGQMRRFTREI